VADLDGILDRLEVLLGEIEAWEEPHRSLAFELLEQVDAVHRFALQRLGEQLGAEVLARLRAGDSAVAWLLDAYAVGVDERAAAEQALRPVLGYVHSHGGEVSVLDVRDGVVRLQMSGECSGCTAAAVTLREGVEKALREGFPGFGRMEVEEEQGARAHPPPGPTLLQIGPRPQ
jgi:Fe-S cluster biogenesis protein NfuA